MPRSALFPAVYARLEWHYAIPFFPEYLWFAFGAAKLVGRQLPQSDSLAQRLANREYQVDVQTVADSRNEWRWFLLSVVSQSQFSFWYIHPFHSKQ